MEVQLQDGTVVKVKDSLTWGDTQKIQSSIISGAKMSGKAGNEDMGFDFDPSSMLEAKYVALECAVIEIQKGETKLSFSREWMDNLSVEDGNKVMEAVDSLSKKK